MKSIVSVTSMYTLGLANGGMSIFSRIIFGIVIFIWIITPVLEDAGIIKK